MKKLLPVLCLFTISLQSLLAQLAPDFTITATDNAQYELYGDYLDNGKTVVLEIMFTTCPPCNDIAPLIQELNQDWGDGQMDVIFLSLSDKNFDDNNDVAAWETMHGLTYHGAGEDGGSLSAVAPYKAGTYGPFNGTPTFVVVAPNGSVQYNPRGSNRFATVDSIDVAIENTGAQRPQVQFTLGGLIQKETGVPIADVEVFLSGQSNPNLSGTDGSYQFFPVDLGNSVSIRPQKLSDPRNGLSVLDLVMIQRHLLLIDIFDSPYQHFAADINRSKSVNVTDLVLLQRMILFVDNEFPNNTSWRFIPESFQFLNPNAPLLIHPPDSIIINNVNADQSDGDFVAIKVGDVSGNASPGAQPVAEPLPALQHPVQLSMEDRYFEAGDRLEIEVSMSQLADLAGFQLALELSPEALQIEWVEKAERAALDQLLIAEQELTVGKIALNWLHPGVNWSGEETLFTISVLTKTSGWISDYIQIVEDDLSAEFYSIGSDEHIYQHEASLDFTGALTGTKPLLADANAVLRVFPNPVANTFQLQTLSNDLQIDRIELLHASGEHLETLLNTQATASFGKQVFSTTHLPAGLYLLKVQSSTHEPMIVKFIKS